MTDDEAILAELPPLLQEIATLTSVAVALTLADAFGGTMLYVPKTARADDNLSSKVGLEAGVPSRPTLWRRRAEGPALRPEEAPGHCPGQRIE